MGKLEIPFITFIWKLLMFTTCFWIHFFSKFKVWESFGWISLPSKIDELIFRIVKIPSTMIIISFFYIRWNSYLRQVDSILNFSLWKFVSFFFSNFIFKTSWRVCDNCWRVYFFQNFMLHEGDTNLRIAYLYC